MQEARRLLESENYRQAAATVKNAAFGLAWANQARVLHGSEARKKKPRILPDSKPRASLEDNEEAKCPLFLRKRFLFARRYRAREDALQVVFRNGYGGARNAGAASLPSQGRVLAQHLASRRAP
jgi:hypothetical protein